MSPGGDTSTGADFDKRVMASVKELDPRADYEYVPTIYGGRKRAISFRAGRESCLVLSVWQGVGGTVDEKFPFLFSNAVHLLDHRNRVFIVLGGGGAGQGAVDWLERASEDYRRIHLLLGADALQGACQRYIAHGEWSGID